MCVRCKRVSESLLSYLTRKRANDALALHLGASPGKKEKRGDVDYPSS